MVSKRRGHAPGKSDVVYTPDWLAQDMVSFFRPRGKILDPCRGKGAFSRLLPDCLWCEIDDGSDFFDWRTPVDWVIGNPPYSLTRRWLRHSYLVADNVCYLVPFRNITSAFGLLEEMRQFGWMSKVRVYGTGSKAGFPMGNCIVAFLAERGYCGETQFSFFGIEGGL